MTIKAAPEAVFAVLADPATHADIDGTGWVQEPLDRAPLTHAGQLFRMGMYHPDHPNGNYQVVNQVEVFDAPRIIGWLTGHDPKGDGHLEFFRRHHCDDQQCNRSQDVAARLQRELRVGNVYVLKGGWAAWLGAQKP